MPSLWRGRRLRYEHHRKRLSRAETVRLGHPPGPLTAPRSLIHYGWLKRAPGILCEPSTASVSRDEALELFPKDQQVQQLKDLALLVSEFMEKEEIEPPTLEGKVIFHAHCHQTSVLHANAAREVLERAELST